MLKRGRGGNGSTDLSGDGGGKNNSLSCLKTFGGLDDWHSFRGGKGGNRG